MKHLKFLAIFGVLLLPLAYIYPLHAQKFSPVLIRQMKGFPSDEQGIEQGTSASFAGVIGNHLIMAGGCNFPEVPAAEGGAKRYYQGIYAAKIAHRPILRWKLIGELPVACAYGVSIPVTDGLICIGGNNKEGSLKQAFEIRLRDGRAVISPLPALPIPMDNFTGARHGSKITVYNGEHLLTLDLTHAQAGWHEEPLSAPDKIHQPVSGFIGNRYAVWGGYTTKTATRPATLAIKGLLLGNSPTTLPAPVDDHSQPIFLGGAAAVNIGDNTILALGGVNKDIFLQALNAPQPGYLSHPVAWYCFNPYICLYDGYRWRILGKSPVTARAGAALVRHGDDLYLIGGELKPGIRTPEIYRLRLRTHFK